MKLTLTRKITALVLAAMLVLTITAASANAGASQASAELRDAAGNVIGFAQFTEDATGQVHVTVHVKGLTPGLHGIHLHAVGSCSPTFAAAGGHHNPLSHQHGLDNPLGAHGGDLPNLIVNSAGVGHLKAVTDRATLSPGASTLFDADGSALVIHADPDDQMTDPTGNSGGRIACGSITNN
jgi:superoxide dismutase, Cu-Zn family